MEEHQDEWQPLPANLIPEGGVATHDFLGYGPVPRLHQEGRETLSIGNFEEGDSIAGRVRYNPANFTRGSVELDKLSEKFKMVCLGIDNGSRKYINFKSEPRNLIFCETVGPTTPLRDRMVRLQSNYGYGANAAGSAGIHTFHRRHTEDAPGCRFEFHRAHAPNWVETRNAMFEMEELEHYKPERPSFSNKPDS